MRKVDFIIIGPQRTGTTWIHEFLKNTKYFNLPISVKETFFFDMKYQLGFSYYDSLFEKNNKIRGEVCPTYFISEKAVLKIKKAYPNCKLIFIYRDPVERSISMYNHHFKKGRVSYDIKDAVEKYPEIIESSMYSKYLKLWKSHFKDQIFMLRYDDLIKNPDEFIKQFSSFLSIKEFKLKQKDLIRLNESKLPVSRNLSFIMSKIATLLRKYDFHSIVNFGKKIRLNKVYMGKNISRNFDKEKVWLKSLFSNEDYL